MTADVLILPVVRSRDATDHKKVWGWAVWNDCQGIFVDTVCWRRNDAAKFTNELDTAGAKVVPVLITLDEDIMREFIEEREYGDWES